MGYVRKLTGVQGQIDSQREQTNATVAAAKQAADDQVRALNDSSRAATAAMAQAADRQRVEQQAADIASKPLAQADVALDPATEGGSSARRKTRAQFGKNYSGVSL